MERIKSIWTTRSIYVDIETGELITKHKTEQDYQIINKIKHVKHDNDCGKKYVEITNECRRNQYKQTRIEY